MTFDRWRQGTIALLSLFALARLVEVMVSAWRARGKPPHREPWWPAMVATHALVIGGSLIAAMVATRMPPPPVVYVAVSLLLAAGLLRVWLHGALAHRWNVRVVDPGEIVTHGPYLYIRHPNYVAVILEVAALPMLAGAWSLAIAATLANGVLLWLRIPFEERALSDRHAAYRDVMMTRPRFAPRLTTRRRH